MEATDKRKSKFVWLVVVTFICTCIWSGTQSKNGSASLPKLTPVTKSQLAAAPDKQTWTTLPHKRTLVVQFVSVERIDEFNLYWESHERHLMVPMNNASLLLSCPHLDTPAVLAQVAEKYNWALIKQLDHTHPLTHGPLSVFRSAKGVEIFLQPLVITFPRYYMNTPTTPHCVGRDFSLSYAMYSGAVFSYHLIQLPLLRKYDIFLKVDTDIEMKKKFPIDVGEDMIENNCHIGHTAIHAARDCERTSLQALKKATTVLGLNTPKSMNYQWCNKDNAGNQNSLIFYGNFLAFSTKLLLRTDVLKVSEYLYNEWSGGYFAARWGDQAPFAMYACHALDIPDLHNDPQVCDYRKYRDEVFVHN